MKTIWKYQLAVGAENRFGMPRGAEVLTVQIQHGQICLWAIVDYEARQEERAFHVAGTGHELPSTVGHVNYIGTVQEAHGQLVWHVFEIDLQ